MHREYHPAENLGAHPARSRPNVVNSRARYLDVSHSHRISLLSDPCSRSSVVEICLAVSCGCLSVIRPFLRHHFPMLLGDTKGGKSSQRYSRYRTSEYIKGGRSTETKSGTHTSSNTRRNIDVIALADRDDSTEMIKPYPDTHHNVDELRHDEEIANPRKSFERDFGVFNLIEPEKAAKPGIMTPSHHSGATRAPAVPRSHREQGIMRTVEVDVDRGTAL